MTTGPTIHASCVAYGAHGVLIRGPSGSGKSSLALSIVQAAAREGRFGRLVADDRTRIEVASGRLIASAPETLAGLLEIRGVGVVAARRLSRVVVRLVVDLTAAPDRMPTEDALQTSIDGVSLPRLAVAPRADEGWSLVSQAILSHCSERGCGAYALAFAPQHEKLPPSARHALF